MHTDFIYGNWNQNIKFLIGRFHCIYTYSFIVWWLPINDGMTLYSITRSHKGIINQLRISCGYPIGITHHIHTHTHARTHKYTCVIYMVYVAVIPLGWGHYQFSITTPYPAANECTYHGNISSVYNSVSNMLSHQQKP